MNDYYYKFSTYLKSTYGEKVWKISLDAGMSCPNCTVDGKEGCIYCRNDSFARHEYFKNHVIGEQMREAIKFAHERTKIKKFIAYFQASTNTFAPLNELENYYETALSFPNVVGIAISTRPDCLPPNVMALIKELSKKTDVWVELGLQSSHDKTLEYINRGHTFKDFQNSVSALKKLNVRICAHIMLGLPGETELDMKRTAERIASMNIHEVKLHPLLILRDTKLADLYASNTFHALSLEEYSKLAVDFMGILPKEMVIQRLTAEAPKSMLVEPLWSMNKLAVINSIRNEFKKRNSFQGKFYKGDKF